MLSSIARGFAALSLMLKQPVSSFCDLDTVDGDTLVGRRGERITFLKVHGLRRMTLRADVEAIANGLRMEMSGSLENPGHAIQAWYSCDPSLSSAEIGRHLQGSRKIARELRLHLADIFSEREKLWPRIMRWEACYFVLWSKPTLLTREEGKQAAEEAKKLTEGAPAIGDAMSPFRENEILSARHDAFVHRVVSAFRNHGIAVQVMTPGDALVAGARGCVSGDRQQRLASHVAWSGPHVALAGWGAWEGRRRPRAVAPDQGSDVLRGRRHARPVEGFHRSP